VATYKAGRTGPAKAGLLALACPVRAAKQQVALISA